MQRYFIKLSFNGTRYHGWQAQDNANTVQAEVEKAFALLFQNKTEITGAGRTDAGVHAREYFAHFNAENIMDDSILADLVYRMNAILPDDISIAKIFSVRNDASARFSAVARTYKYYISRAKDPFSKEYAWNVFGKIDVPKMNDAAPILFEYIDFTSFSKLRTDVKTNICKIIQAAWTEENNMLIFTITADRFLRNMVRAIVGTLIDVGKGKITTDDFRNIIEKKNRNEAGFSVPARGLFLEKIEYPPGILEMV